MICHCSDLPLPVFRGSKERYLDEVIVAAASEAVAHTCTTCISECCYNVVYGVCMDLLLHAPLGQSACMYGRRGVLHLLLFCTCISPFLSPFLFYACVRLFFLYSMAVYVFVCVCICGGAPLSLFLWIVAGMVVVGWLDSRGICEEQGPYCNCGDAEGLDEAIAGLPTATS